MTDTLRKYGYGTPLLYQDCAGNVKRATAIGAAQDDAGFPICDASDQQGTPIWFYDTQIVRVIK